MERENIQICLAKPGIKLECDPDNRGYFLNGRSVPGLTDVLKSVGIIPQIHYASDFALWRGKCVHRGIELMNKKKLDWKTVDEEIKPFLDSYGEFIAATGFVVEKAEGYCCSPTLGVAGRFDLRGRFPDGRRAMGDVKTGLVMSWTGIQLSGYELMEKGLMGCPRENWVRFALQLKGKKVKIKMFKNDHSDEEIFLSACSILNWRKNNHGSKW